jgi:hypothetical protein
MEFTTHEVEITIDNSISDFNNAADEQIDALAFLSKPEKRSFRKAEGEIDLYAKCKVAWSAEIGFKTWGIDSIMPYNVKLIGILDFDNSECYEEHEIGYFIFEIELSEFEVTENIIIEKETLELHPTSVHIDLLNKKATVNYN